MFGFLKVPDVGLFQCNCKVQHGFIAKLLFFSVLCVNNENGYIDYSPNNSNLRVPRALCGKKSLSRILVSIKLAELAKLLKPAKLKRMLLKNEILEQIIAGNISLVFRRWKRATVKTGGSLKTRKGVLSIKSVETIEESKITAADAKKAGFTEIKELKAMLSDREGEIYKISVSFAGEDPRVALRKSTKISKADLEEIQTTLERWDQSKVFGKWTLKYLKMIHDQPNTHAQILADSVGLAKNRFKGNVRKLKELGLTESLRPGYKLSPRGEKVYSLLSTKK